MQNEENEQKEAPSVVDKAKRLFSMRTLVIIVLYPVKWLLDFARETMYHISSVTGKNDDYTSQYSLTYLGVSVMVLGLSYAGISADYDVLFGYFFNVTFDHKWSNDLALITAISIGLGLFITTSNITRIAMGKLYKKKNAPEKHKDHVWQLILNGVFLAICGTSTVLLSINSGEALRTRTNIVKKEAQEEKTSIDSSNFVAYSGELKTIELEFKRDSAALYGEYANKALEASSSARKDLDRVLLRMKNLRARKAKNWAEKLWLNKEVEKLKMKDSVRYAKKIESKEADDWAEYNNKLKALSDSVKTYRKIAKASYISKTGNDTEDLDEFIEGLEETSLSSATLFKVRNILMNLGVVILTLMLSIYMKGTRNDVEKREKIEGKNVKKPKETTKQPPQETPSNVDDKEETGGETKESETGGVDPSVKKPKVKYQDLAALRKRAARRYELSFKQTSAEETRERNFRGCLSDLAFLKERGYSAKINDGKLSMECDGRGFVTPDLENLLDEYKDQINDHREQKDDLSKYRK